MQEVPAMIAALPREIAAVVRGTSADPAWLRHGISLYRLPHALVVAAGMGADRAEAAVEAAIAAQPISSLISVGLAGACSPQMVAGQVIEAGIVVDAQSGARFAASKAGTCVLASGSAIASVAEKLRLHNLFGAALVDMEAATVARLAAARGLPFRAIKGVSDGFDFELEGLAKFTGALGSFRTGAFALHTAVRPWTWSQAMKLGRDSGRALAGLNDRLQAIMLEG